MDGSILVGIAGGSASGKTTLAQALEARIGPERIGVLVADHYYRDIDWRDTEEIRRHDFDRPEALELSLLATHLRELRAGRTIEVPRYDFGTHRRLTETRRLEAHPVTLVDGLLLFVDPEIRALFDLRVFVDTPADLRLARRILRDTVERRRDVRDVIRQYLETVRPAYEEVVVPSREHADLIIPGIGDYQTAVDQVIARLGPRLVF